MKIAFQAAKWYSSEKIWGRLYGEVLYVVLGADLLLNALEEQGVDTVFGLPGGSVIPL